MSEPRRLLLDDRPTEKPWQSLQELADRIADAIPDFPSSSPLLVSGEWGLGKSTLLKAIQRRLRSAKPNEVPRALLFEAWRYEGELPLLPALVRFLWTSVEKNLPKGNISNARTIWKQLWEATVVFSASAGPSLANLVGGPVGQALFSGLVSIWENTGKAKEEDLATAINRLTQDRTEDLWQKFSDLIGLLWQDPNRPLVILIDDLDRCSPAGAVALLESVRMILANAENLNCRFIVALDRGVLAQAVAKKFADLGHYEGNRYLGKIFPLGFDLPRPNPVEVKDLIERGLEELMLTGGPFSEVLHRALAPAIFANPRLIKRCINRFHLYSRFEENSRKPKADWTDTEIRDAIGFVEWMAATERWPRLRPLLNLRERSYWLEVRTSLSDPMHQPPDSEAEELRRERDLPAWLGGKLASGPEALYEAEKRLRKWGL